MTRAEPPRLGYRGGPLVMLLLLVAVWAMLRVAWWEDPFAPAAEAREGARGAGIAPRSLASPILLAGVGFPEVAYDPAAAGLPVPGGAAGAVRWRRVPRAARPRRLLSYAPAPELRLPGVSPVPGLPPGVSRANPPAGLAAAQDNAPFLAAAAPPSGSAKRKRWSVDAWAFYRDGSAAGVPVSQGRVPIYGASQAGAILQYRLGSMGGHEPRLYLRGYKALVPGGESEAALGASLRPLPRVPLRLAAEARYTAPETGEASVRPAVYAITEIAPIALPLGTRLEAYGQAGWVGGPGRTAFADGQAALTREIGLVGRMSHDAVRLSLGAGAWGGAQKGAERLDVGPTLRLDLKVGRVPARLSVDWRQRVGGDAVPDSGISATLSTGF